MEEDRFDIFIFYSLIGINILVFLNMFLGFLGIHISWIIVLLELIPISAGFFAYATLPKEVNNLSYFLIPISAVAVVLNLYLQKYFSVVTWDGASYLLNARMFITQDPILYSYYRPLTWSSFLSIGLAFNLKEMIPLVTMLMLVLSIYLFTLTMTKNRIAALVSATLSLLVPVFLLWGLSYYADAYLVVLVTLGFACYFHYRNTGSRMFFFYTMFLFTMAFLTKYSFGVLFIVPLFELKQKYISASAILGVMLPYLAYIQVVTGNLFYSFLMYFNTANADVGHNVFSNMYYITSMQSMFSWVLFGLGVIGIITLLRSRNFLVLGIVAALEIIYLLFFFHLKDIRYFMFAVPVLLAGAAVAIYRMSLFFGKYKYGVLCVVSLIAIVLLSINLVSEIIPMYKYSGRDILAEASRMPLEGNIVSNSHVRMTWYMQRKVFSAVPLENLSDYILKNNIRYIVNFEHSGTPVEFKNTSRLLEFGELVGSFDDGFERINVIRVQTNNIK